ncbi:ulp1 protease family, C-terminal catalytic domain-containing protein [Artemisia annua]|uniref:Ulp1 protease family, C-terminal catalytic domain-containing protein n=1 Tax=Artemisia annua TaxID=35608 RepID=A0A2U1L833_ARTAN|nr:ulp1 protease family, C-terminal catalytic domain-containing protein [Artemisia annua]
MYAEKWAARGGRQQLLNGVDVVYLTNTVDVRVAAILKPWKDCGIFVMRHMEHYMGTPVIYWRCGLLPEGKKQTSQLGKLKRKYDARLLLSECNLQKDNICTQMACILEKNVGVKTTKVPLARI